MKFEAIMLDLDQTLVDTSELKVWRDEFAWEECYNHFHLTRTYPHLQVFLESLTTKKIGVVTNSPGAYASKLMDFHNIPYDHLISYQKHGRNKPYPDQLLRCANELGVNPKRCIYIGDDPNDMVAAKIAGFHSVGFCEDNQRLEEFISYMPDIIFSDYLELVTYVQKLDDPFIYQQMTDTYEQALSAKQASNGRKYLNLLKEAAKFGHGQAQYKLSKLLNKNPAFIEGDRNSEYYMRQSAKQMTPEAIYEIGYGYEREGNMIVAEQLYRAAANLGLPHAQFHFGKAKLTKMGTPANISYRWIHKSVASGLSKGEGLLERVTRVVNLETELKDRLLFDYDHGIYYLGSYIPEKRYDDFFSHEILKVKDEQDSAIRYFLGEFEGYGLNDILICYVPSSDKNNVDTGIRRMARGLSGNNVIDATDCLFRYRSKEKSSQGGDRSIETHRNTLVVQNEEMIKGGHVLLFDDITTTGSALLACEQLLLEAGALHVTKIALGRTK